jgi:tripartite-type tricarboxylate transporter receptor subunit TctC
MMPTGTSRDGHEETTVHLQIPTALIAGLLSSTVACGTTQAASSGAIPGNGPITIVVPTSVGTSADIVGRALSVTLSAKWKRPIVVDNKTGASGSIGIAAVAQAPADGQTILVATNTISMLGSINKNLPWSPQSFEPVGLMGRTVTALVVNPTIGANSLNELVAMAKAKPGQLNYATPGVGTPHHLYTELFKQITHTEILHVPYKATAGAVTDIAGGRTQLGFFPLNSIMPLVKANKLKLLATAGDERSPTTPDVPTFKEAGLDGVQASSWIGVFLPKATPQPVVTRLAADLGQALASAEFKEELRRQEIVPNENFGGSSELAALLRSDTDRWKTVVDQARIEAE